MVDSWREAVTMPARQPPGARRITSQLAKLGGVLPGTVRRRYTRCGRAGCRCMADPAQPHGPYWSWTRKVANKTVTRYLSEEQYERYRPWFDNAHRARELLGELEAASLLVVETDTDSARRRRSTAPSPTSAEGVETPRLRRP